MERSIFITSILRLFVLVQLVTVGIQIKVGTQIKFGKKSKDVLLYCSVHSDRLYVLCMNAVFGLLIADSNEALSDLSR